MFKFKILETVDRLYSSGVRLLKGERFAGDNHVAAEYHSGGDDYNPPDNTQSISVSLNNNNADTAVVAFLDEILRVSGKGEKRSYSTNTAGTSVMIDIRLKSDGKISINSGGQDLVDLIKQLATACEQILTPTMMGPQPPLNKATFTAIVANLGNFT